MKGSLDGLCRRAPDLLRRRTRLVWRVALREFSRSIRRRLSGPNGPHVLLHGEHVWISALFVECERAVDDHADVRRRVFGDRADERSWLRRHFDEHLGFVRRLVDASFREQAEHHRAGGEDVCAVVYVSAPDLLGRHIRQGAEHRSEARLDRVVHARRPRDAEVEQFCAAGMQDKDVVEFDVAMNDALAVDGCEDIEDFIDHGQHFVDREPVQAFGAVREGFAFEQLHHEEGQAVVGGTHRKHFDGAWMAESA